MLAFHDEGRAWIDDACIPAAPVSLPVTYSHVFDCVARGWGEKQVVMVTVAWDRLPRVALARPQIGTFGLRLRGSAAPGDPGDLARAIQVPPTLSDTSAQECTYVAAHGLNSGKDTAGNSVTYTLDNMGNRTGEDLKDPSGTLARNITRVYDALNRAQSTTGATQ